MMSNVGYKSKDVEINKLIDRLNNIITELEERINKLEKKVG